jgi:hypothetical protein
MTGTGYYGHVAITLGEVRGVPTADPALEVELKISADGFAPGVSAMLLPTCHAQGTTSPIVLGQAEIIILQLGFEPSQGGGKPYSTSEYARWRLTANAVEQLEQIRDGKDLTLHVSSTVVLLNHGGSLQDVNPQPVGVARPNVYPHSPIWHAGQQQLRVTAETWAHWVLSPWQQAAAVTLVVKLPTATATDDHRTVVHALTDAKQRLDTGDWKGSIRASRDATEVLRSMHTQQLNPKKTQRTLDEREASILDAEHSLIQALFDYGSATHPDPALRATAWNRQHAFLALATATAVAQRLFSALPL